MSGECEHLSNCTKQLLINTFVNRKNGTQGVCVNNCTHQDHVLWRNKAFTKQIPAMTNAYLVWNLEKSKMGHHSFFDQFHNKELNEGSEWVMTVADAFCE
jgi:hypothetical protein